MSKKRSLASVLAIAGVLVLPQGSGAQVPRQDSASGSGSTPSSFTGGFDFSATSDPLGGSPSGTASWEQFSAFHFEGTVSCLAVTGNQAVIGVDVDTAASSISFQGFFLTAVDNGPPGSGLDTVDATPTTITSAGDVVPTDCTVGFTRLAQDQVTSGDIVVIDAPPLPTSKDQCKNGGWQSYGVFKNQGDCVSFVATGGKNQPAGAG
jgi:hypothetical protein